MTQRTSIKTLEAIVGWINDITDSPSEPYTRDANGFHANVGNYHLSQAYGGVNLVRMVNDAGGVSEPIGPGHIPKRELEMKLRAFYAGLEQAKEATK